MIKIKILADGIRDEDSQYIMDKLQADAKKHGYKIRTSDSEAFTFWGDNGTINMIYFDNEKSCICQSIATGDGKKIDKELEKKQTSKKLEALIEKLKEENERSENGKDTNYTSSHRRNQKER